MGDSVKMAGLRLSHVLTGYIVNFDVLGSYPQILQHASGSLCGERRMASMFTPSSVSGVHLSFRIGRGATGLCSGQPGASSQPRGRHRTHVVLVPLCDRSPSAIPPSSLKSRIKDTFKAHWHLGFTSFGGPGTHVVIFERLFVERLLWLDPRTFADLFSISNALPGPGSTQLAFSIALVKYGELAGILAFLLFALPGALGMSALGFAVQKFPNELPQIVLAVLTGINAAGSLIPTEYAHAVCLTRSSAVGLIALAAYKLSLTTVTDRITRLLLCLSAAIGLLYTSIWLDAEKKDGESSASPVVADLAPLLAPSDSPSALEPLLASLFTVSPTMLLETSVSVPKSISFLVLFICTFVSGVIFRAAVSNAPRIWNFGVNLFIAGSIIFGGGPVVIPVLREYAVDPGWVLDRDFLFGFAILQAFPGPNFNFSAYLGVLANPEHPVLGALTGWIAIFTPGLILKFALLPFYVKLREKRVARSLLRGLNAAAVGLIFVAVVQLWKAGARTVKGPTTLESDTWCLIVGSMSFVSVQWYNNPPPVAIVMGGIAGLACKMGRIPSVPSG
ncbi:hypothetical protein BS47DRAFT_1393497 [Hydnum rufescens UP504]|uniref:Chromate transporter n=1 Tax=Hydnum rufescens UP504 TaxID=1448309 RepID=A0A9P6AWJ5_9AGAM|nr:hypothetical protein BS47DRAFT_1393497 [Hydnum rufescens UP504]